MLNQNVTFINESFNDMTINWGFAVSIPGGGRYIYEPLVGTKWVSIKVLKPDWIDVSNVQEINFSTEKGLELVTPGDVYEVKLMNNKEPEDLYVRWSVEVEVSGQSRSVITSDRIQYGGASLYISKTGFEQDLRQGDAVIYDDYYGARWIR